MTCVHLKKLYHFCQEESIKIGGADLLRIVCEQCGVQEECPSMLMEQFEAKQAKAEKSAAAKTGPAEQ